MIKLSYRFLIINFSSLGPVTKGGNFLKKKLVKPRHKCPPGVVAEWAAEVGWGLSEPAEVPPPPPPTQTCKSSDNWCPG